MSPRKTILRELSSRLDRGESGYARPDTIGGFNDNPAAYQLAVNRLLQERLINGTRDEGGRTAVALNPHRLEDVKKALRPWYARPITWLTAASVIIVALAFAI